MSDKLVRDELLRSHRYQSLSGDTQKLLFLHLLLASDNLSNAEATTTALSMIMGRTITEESAAALLSELQDHRLLFTYPSDGKMYVHIPRSRQRLRYLRGKHPRPPAEIEDKEIRDLIEKVGLQTDRGQTIVARREEKRSVAKQPKTVPEPVDKSAKWWATLESLQQKATALGLKANPGETRDALYRRVRAKLNAKEKTK